MHVMSVKPPACQMLNSDFICTVQWWLQICYEPFPQYLRAISNINLFNVLLKMQIWNGFNVFNIPGNLIKDINVNLSILSVGWKVVEWTSQDWQKFLNCIFKCRIGSCGIYPPTQEIFQNLLFHVLSNYTWKFAINSFPITWGPLENINLLYFLHQMQIWNGFNVLNIAGNFIKISM